MTATGEAVMIVQSAGGRKRGRITLVLGLLIILFSEFYLFEDVRLSGRGAVHSEAAVEAILAEKPVGLHAKIARIVAVNVTPFAWTGYLLLLDGVLAMRGESPIRKRRHHFWTLYLASVFIWCVFDAINFNAGMRAWNYIGLPKEFGDRVLGYLLAFGAIVPGMLLSGQLYLSLGLFDWARSPAWKMPAWCKWLALLAGAAMLAWPLIHRDPIVNLTLWTSLVFLLDPINLRLGRPSMFRDWQNGWYGRTLAAFAGGATCGLLWEFWNYWALTKWTYNLPFLGSWEQYRYFEMPLIGFIGFVPFGIECWVMWQTIRIPLDGMVEPLPDERTLL